MKRALIVVDMQYDFIKGTLAVPYAEEIIPAIKTLLHFSEHYSAVVFTADAHPLNSKEFKTNGGEWPVHCVENTIGSQITPEIADYWVRKHNLFKKGTTDDAEAYSGFLGANYFEQTLEDYLNDRAVTSVDVVGLALDYCVKHTALDAVKKGFESLVLLDYTRSVDQEQNEEVVKELWDEGVIVV